MDATHIHPLPLSTTALFRFVLSATAEEVPAALSAATLGEAIDNHGQEASANLPEHRHGVVGECHADGTDREGLINKQKI